MKGYPRLIATKQDFINLIAEPEFKAQALADLLTVYELDDDTVERVVSYDTDDEGRMINVVTEAVAATMPRWKQLGFESRESVLELYNSY